MPRLTLPDYDPKVENLSVRTWVPFPAGGTSPSGSPIAAVAPEVFTSAPTAHVVEGSPIDADKTTPAPIQALVARAAP